ncbi:MAG: hypothetical protein KAS32_05190 [Candidatus Peribacteraceae bacterium]|nr:hypothetical protein [Candidatus Peribacteraceae bacterium]
MAFADNQGWILGEPTVSSGDEGVWVLGQAQGLLQLGVAHVKALSDTLAITDSLVKAIGKVQSDTMGITDSFSKVSAFVRAYADTMNITDSLVKAFGKRPSDTVTITDTFTRIVAWIRGLSDTVTITDSPGKAIGKFLADTMTIADSLIATILRGKIIELVVKLYNRLASLWIRDRSLTTKIDDRDIIVKTRQD